MLHNVRTRVSEDVFNSLTGEAALEGVSLAELIRRLLTAHAGQAEAAAPAVGSMTVAEREPYSLWLEACTDTPDKRSWRALVDSTLRGRGVDLPPLSDTIEWAIAVHPYTRAAKRGVTPPRWDQ